MTLQQQPTRTQEASAGPGLWPQLRPLVLRLHFYAGVLVAPFILVAAVTGLAYTAAPQLESVVYHAQLHVDPAGPRIPLSQQLAAARRAHPEGDLLSVTPPADRSSSTRVVFADGSVPPDHAKTVFVDPHDGQVLGQVTSFGQWLGVRAWLDEMHRTLHLGSVGRSYSELAASWLWVVVLGGVALWVGRRRTARRARQLLAVDRRTTGRRRTLSWHGVMGAWIAVGLLLLAGSGLTWSRFAGAQIGEVRSSLDWSSRPLSTELAGGRTPADTEHRHGSGGATGTRTNDDLVAEGGGIDAVLDAAREQGLRAPMDLVPPADASSAWTVSENKRSAPTQHDSISVDPGTGDVVDRLDQGDWPFMAKVQDWVVGAHMGILLGLANQVALALLAVGLILVTLRGYRMWWQRRPSRGGRVAVGRPAPRGSLRRTSHPVQALVVGLAVLVAWFVPLLGLSLAVFVVVDVLLGLRQRRRSGRSDSLEPAALLPGA